MGNKPRIRFKGFTEDWEQRKLIDTAKTFIGLVTTMTENYRDSGTLLIRNSDIKEGQFVFSEKPIHLDEEFAEKNKTRRLQIGDVVTVHTGDIGTSAVIQEKEAGAIGFATINTRTDKRILNPYFLSTYFNTEKHKCYANSVSTGDGRSNYNIKDFNKLVISIPTLDEQEKISVLINNINTIITLHQCKLEKLKLTKKALLQKLFPKNGKHIPEIRFKGFTDAWEQRKFLEITYLSGIKNKENKPYESYSISNEFGFIPQNEQFENGGTMKTADKSMYYIVTQNSFAYNPARINVGSIGYYDKPDNVIVSSLYEVFKTTEIVNDKFLWHWFKSNQFNHLIEKYQEGGVRLYFYYDKLCKGTIELPTIDEQNKISNLLDGLDLYITLHQRKLERLQEVKKGLLQKMFV